MKWLVDLVVFVAVLAIMKFFFGWNISIIGSLVLTLVFAGVYHVLGRARA